jgi:ketosteroid isomerase-like protein
VSDEQQIEAIHRKWILAKLSGEIESLLELCSDDVKLNAPGKDPIAGKSALEGFLRGSEETMVEVHSDAVEVKVSGDDAKKSARFSARMASGRSERRVRGRHIWALRRIGNQWKITEVGWTVDEDVALR